MRTELKKLDENILIKSFERLNKDPVKKDHFFILEENFDFKMVLEIISKKISIKLEKDLN